MYPHSLEVYSKYLEILQLLGYDLLGNLGNLVGISNSIVSVGATLAIKPGHRNLTVREAIEVLLYRAGFFSEEKNLNGIMVELERKGYNFPKPTVANTLETLTKTFLSRSGHPRSYRYKQKIPPFEYYKTVA